MNKTAEVKWPQYQVFEADNSLRAKALVAGNPVDALASATKRADRALRQLSVKFPAWMKTESQRLSKIRDELANNGPSIERLDRLFTCSHDIKGQAQTYGYPLAAMIGKILCDLIVHAPDCRKIPLAVIDQHVDTIKAIVRQDIKGDSNTQINTIIQGLHALDHTTLKKISRKKAIVRGG